MADGEFQKLSNDRFIEILDFETGQKKLESLKRMRARVNWEIEEERESFYWQLCRLINDWKSRLPDLREIFRREEIDWLLARCVHIGPAELIKFVIRTGYRDEPDLDEDGKPLLRRNTPVLYAAGHRICDWVSKIRVLFKIYDKFNVNYTSESGLTHFHVACMSGCDDIVEKFLELGQDPNLPMKETGDTPLHLALKNKHHKVIESLLRRGSDPKLSSADEGLISLHFIALREIDDDLMKWFFEICNDMQLKVQVNAQDNYGNTPLHMALVRGHKEMVKDLLRRGANVNLAQKDGFTALHIICRRRHDDGLIEMFFEICDDIQQTVKVDTPDKSGRTPLHLALSKGNKKAAESLLRRGANPNLASAEGLTSLHFISLRRRDDDLLEKFLQIIFDIQQTVQVNAKDKLGTTPLYIALVYNLKNMVESLLKRGADPNLANSEGSTSLHYIAFRKIDDDMMEWFLEIGDNMQLKMQIDARNNLGLTPLHLALVYGTKKIAEALLRRGANPNLANSEGLTYLHFIALRKIDDDLVEWFLEISDNMQLKVQVDARNNLGQTPLHLALYTGKTKMVEALLKRGANPNSADKEGSTALHFISKGKYNDDLVKLYFNINDDKHQLVQVNARDNLGHTPLHFAVMKLLPHVIDVLLDRGADLSSFVFPTEDDFYEMFDEINREWDKLRLASGILVVVECLNKRGFELELNDVLTIIKLFVEYGMFEKSSDLEKCWYDEEEFTNKAKEIVITPNLSLYDLILLPSEKEVKLLSYTNYFEVERLNNLNKIPEQYRDKCLRHLCEKVSRKYFKRLALDALQELIHYRLPILCSDMVIENLKNEDLFRIYEAGEIVAKENNAKLSDTVDKGPPVEQKVQLIKRQRS